MCAAHGYDTSDVLTILRAGERQEADLHEAKALRKCQATDLISRYFAGFG